MFVKYFLVGFAIFGRALGNQRCFSSVICNVEGSDNPSTSWIQIYPPSKCNGMNDVGSLENEYKESLRNFITDLGDNSSSELSASMSDKGSGRCFMPVVCSSTGGSLTDWLQVYGNSCGGEITDDDSRRIFDHYAQLASGNATEKVKEMCSECSNYTFDGFFQSSNAVAREADQCFAPVICSESDKTDENWMKVYPPANCDDTVKITTIEISKAKRTYDKALLRVVEAYRDINASGCAVCSS